MINDKSDLSARALKAGRPRKADGKQQTPESFLKLLHQRAEVYPYFGGLWAVCETNGGGLVLINSNDDDAHVWARFTLAPRFVGFLGFKKGEGNSITDAFCKPWQTDGQAKLERVKAPLESITVLQALAAAHQESRTVFSPQDLIRLLIMHSAELPWAEFALVLRDGRKVGPEDEDLSPGLLKANPAIGFIGLLLLGGRIFRFRWQVVAGSIEQKLLKRIHAEAETSLRDVRPQPTDLMVHLAVDTIALLRSH